VIFLKRINSRRGKIKGALGSGGSRLYPSHGIMMALRMKSMPFSPKALAAFPAYVKKVCRKQLSINWIPKRRKKSFRLAPNWKLGKPKEGITK